MLGFGFSLPQVAARGKGVGIQPVYLTETDTLAAAFTTPPTTRRKKSNDWAIRKLKTFPRNDPVWPRLLGFWKVGADAQASRVNWKSPGTYDLQLIGTPTFTADTNYAPNAAYGLNTGILASALATDDWSIFFHQTTFTANATTDVGANDAAANGITVNAKHTANNTMVARGGAAVTTLIGAAADWDGTGFCGISRSSSAGYYAYKGPANKAFVAGAATTLPARAIYFLGRNNDGSFIVGSNAQTCWAIGRSLSDAQVAVLNAVMRQLDQLYRGGELDYYRPRTLPTAVTADFVVYGTTPGALLAAYEAHRQGRTVAIVGGWRDRHLGGMSAGGLGFVDLNNETALSGLPKYLFSRARTLSGAATTFSPLAFSRAIREMFDPRFTVGRDIPVYWSDGVASVAKSGTRITSFRTVDGRTFTGTEFHDGSYEGDLVRLAGLSYNVGREAAGSGNEAAGGFRSTSTLYGAGTYQFNNHAGANVTVDPFVTPGVQASGLIAGLDGTMGVGTPSLGAAINTTQAYNFRVAGTTTKAAMAPYPATPPAGYSAAQFELLLRHLATDATLTFTDIITANAVDSGSIVYDMNNGSPGSLDYIGGGSSEYPLASYSRREEIWQAHKAYTLGLFYTLQYSADSRLPSALKTTALTWGHLDYYWDWHDNDTGPNWSPQLYVREAIRMASDIVWDGNDVTGTDGGTPRSVKTIAAGSYNCDSHYHSRYADNSLGSWRVWCEGNMFVAAGGTDQMFPLPMEIVTPKAAECTNLTASFCISSTHVAFGAIRMEFTAAMLGQSAGMMAALAIEGGNIDVQSINYTTLRTRLLASPTLSGETTPYLPQVH